MTIPVIAGSWRWPATGWRTCFRSGPSSPAITSACVDWRQIVRALEMIALDAPSRGDQLRLLDSTPIPCAASRTTVKRSALAGIAGYGYCASHSRYFWGFRLYVLCTPDRMPFGFELAPADAPEREVAAEVLARAHRPGDTIITDKGFAGTEFEQLVLDLGCRLIRPDRRDEPHRHGNLGGIRQWIEAIIWSAKDKLSLERHGARTLPGLIARISPRPRPRHRHLAQLPNRPPPRPLPRPLRPD